MAALKLTQYRRLKGAADKIASIVSEIWYCMPETAAADTEGLIKLQQKMTAVLAENAHHENHSPTSKATLPLADLDPRTPEQKALDEQALTGLATGQTSFLDPVSIPVTLVTEGTPALSVTST